MVTTKILGTDYEIVIDDLNNVELSDYSGKCYGYKKQILLRHPQYMFTDNASDEEKRERFTEVLTHELIHAFARETASHYDDDENLVDWIAILIPKIVKACNDIIDKLKEEERNGNI